MKLSRKIIIVSAVGMALSATAGSITYQGSDTEADVSVSYTITTDGTIGVLSLANILSSTITFTGLDSSGPYDFASFTAYNNIYFYNSYGPSPVSATPTELLFDFSGGGTLNFVTQNCDVVGCFPYTSDPTPNATVAGMVWALAGLNSTDTDNVVYHEIGPNGASVQPDKELDNPTLYNGNYYLQPGTYTLVAATDQAIATAEAPEPATWGMMLAGVGLMGIAMRRRG